MIRISFDFADVGVAIAALERFRTEPEPAPIAEVNGDLHVADWFGRLGTASRNSWLNVAQHAQTHADWTLDEIAGRMGESIDAIRAYHRNSYRAIRAEEVDHVAEKVGRKCAVLRLRHAR